MASRLPWFRMYADFLNDPKMISIAFEDQRHFIGILALKCDGILDQDCAPEIMDRIVSQKLWVEYSIISDIKKRLIDAELIDSKWQPKSWNKRQFVSDHDPTGAERQRRYREKQKAENKRNALRNGTVTPPDTDTDTDTDITVSFDKFWAAYPKKKNKGQARKAWEKLNPSADLQTKILNQLSVAKQSKEWQKQQGQFIPYPSTWINAEGWEDEYSGGFMEDDGFAGMSKAEQYAAI